MKVIQKEFFTGQSTVDLAKKLLGKILVHETSSGLISGRIVETEAYLHNDPAAHSYIGKTSRNKSVFEEAGTTYVYFIYGVYYCFNVSSNVEGIGEAVLVRALEPLEGIELVQERLSNRSRLKAQINSKLPSPNSKLNIPNTKLLNGPGKLCVGLGIDRSLDGHKLWEPPIYIAEDDYKVKDKDIVITTRIGITKAADLPLRFYIKNSPFLSRK